MADVFISYQRAEREAVQIIVDRLAVLKLDVWFDAKLNPGVSFDEEIAQAIKDAKAVLTCWTPAALASEWVRGEATLARKEDRFVACFLEPTELIPPFNLTHAEDLYAWAGQEDDPAWLKVLERIGDLVGRPGLPSFNVVMRPSATVQVLRAWATANGADPLAGAVWARIAAIEGEDAHARLEREKQEALVLGQKRKAQAARSRELARQRGLRDPNRERRRWLVLLGVIVAVGLISAGGLMYTQDEQQRERYLRDHANTPAEVRKFITDNRWHPIAAVAQGKLGLLDAEAWRVAVSAGSIEALQN